MTPKSTSISASQKRKPREWVVVLSEGILYDIQNMQYGVPHDLIRVREVLPLPKANKKRSKQ